MAKSHGREVVFKLDNLAGSLNDISTYLDNVGFQPSADRPETQTFGQNAKRRQVLGLRDGGTISVAGFFVPVTAKLHGRTNKLLVDHLELTTYFDTCSISRSCELSETQTFGDNWKERGVPGLTDGSMSLGGFFDSVANGPDARVKVALGDTDGQIVTRGNDFAIGSLVDLLQAAETSYEEPGNENEVNRMSAEFVPDGPIDLGVSLHDHTNVTATGAFTRVDESAATTNGGVGHLHVTTFGGSGNPTISIMNSSTTATGAALITFTALTAATAQRVEVTGNVKRYLYAQVNTAGSVAGGVTFQVSFARRGFAYGTAGTYRHWCGMLQNANSQSFEYGPEGGATNDKKLSGEVRLGSLEVNFNENEVVKFSADLMVDGAISTGAF